MSNFKFFFIVIELNLWVKLFTKSLKDEYGEYVVITNVVDCIGFQFAKAFAKKGHSLILIASKSEVLERVKSALEKCVKPGRKVEIIVYDETQPEHVYFVKVEKLLHEVKDKIGILLNNCSLKLKPGNKLLDYSRNDILELLYANVAYPVLITQLVIPFMIENKKGLIVNVTMPDNFRPVEHKGFPHVMREFIKFFGEVISRDCDAHNIDVQTVNPGWISNRRQGSKRFPDFLLQSPATFVDSVMPCVGRTDKSCGCLIHSILREFLNNAPKIVHETIYYAYRAVNGKYDDLNESQEIDDMMKELEENIKECDCEIHDQ
ncbi:hydroxysteroid dehydrogenase-like protein 3 [Leptotrombidium deliense]|uniref:Hydroxysteroid dehydrogenase-like protein 3 n=1 Tax=Leptotrombidium deliense TaxID=299467 RepID=A0A443SGM4_9ACAR|nr:hydroxysteroid dehydrogenase-like protein 3 [Leptotrombidium deliense]